MLSIIYILLHFVNSRCVSYEECQDIRANSKYWKSDENDAYHDADLITKGLYLGNVCSAHDEQWLLNHNIALIISVAKEWKAYTCPFNTSSIRQLFYDIDDRNDEDSEKVTRLFNNAAHTIDNYIKQGENVLVHCNMGISRSTSVVIRYLQLKYPRKSYRKLLHLVKQRRPVATPNNLFSRILVGSSIDL